MQRKDITTGMRVAIYADWPYVPSGRTLNGTDVEEGATPQTTKLPGVKNRRASSIVTGTVTSVNADMYVESSSSWHSRWKRSTGGIEITLDQPIQIGYGEGARQSYKLITIPKCVLSTAAEEEQRRTAAAQHRVDQTARLTAAQEAALPKLAKARVLLAAAGIPEYQLRTKTQGQHTPEGQYRTYTIGGEITLSLAQLEQLLADAAAS